MKILLLIFGVFFLVSCDSEKKYPCSTCKDTGLRTCGECKGVGKINECKYDWCAVKKCNALDHRQNCSVMLCRQGKTTCFCDKGRTIEKVRMERFQPLSKINK